MTKRVVNFIAIIAVWLPVTVSVGYAADGGRGRLLYQNHCVACHESIVHVREGHKVRSLDGLRQQVMRWAGELGIDWRREEIEDVVQYLDDEYYHERNETRQ